jgi:hypothetical protein
MNCCGEASYHRHRLINSHVQTTQILLLNIHKFEIIQFTIVSLKIRRFRGLLLCVSFSLLGVYGILRFRVQLTSLFSLLSINI